MRRSMAVFVVAVMAAAGLSLGAGPVLAQSGGLEPNLGAYPDVGEDVYYSVPVVALREGGVFDGTECSRGGFCPDLPIDRVTMAVWVVRVLDGRAPAAVSGSRFGDVDGADWRAGHVERMAELGVTEGCGDGSRFCPAQYVTRAQMAVFLTRAFDLPAGPDPGFADVAPDAWYGADVAALAASGITSGCGDGTGFCPGDYTTRAQMATFLYRAAARQGRAAVEVTGFDDSIDLQVTYDEQRYEATATWRAPPGSHGPVEHYVLQSRTMLTDFGPEYTAPPALGGTVATRRTVLEHFGAVSYRIVDSEAGTATYRATVPARTHNHLYAVRVIAVYANGDRLATSEVKVPSDVRRLRDVIWEKIVEPNQRSQPWLADTWIHMNDFARFGLGFGAGSAGRGGEYRPGELYRSFSGGLTIGKGILHNQSSYYTVTAIEEMGHVYTLTHWINQNPASVGIGSLYLSLLSFDHGPKAKNPTRCGAGELYGDLAIMVFWDRYSDFDAVVGLHYRDDGISMSEWDSCGFRLDGATKAMVDEEIPKIAKSVFIDQEIPQWFYDTYQGPDGAIDLERLWADITKGHGGFIAYSLRNEFGGYCSEKQVRQFIDGRIDGITNPWRDGGCKDSVIMEGEDNEYTDTDDNGAVDSGVPVEIPTPINYPMDFLERFRSTPDNCWVAVNGYAYDVTPGRGYEYPGPGSITDLCGQDASDHFSSNNIELPPQEYVVGSIRS